MDFILKFQKVTRVALLPMLLLQCMTLKAQLKGGTVVAWGDNSAGQTNVPLTLTNAVSVAACANNSVALNLDGTVEVWGNVSEGPPPPGLSNVTAVSVGNYHYLALKSDGTVVAWGMPNFVGANDVPGNLTNAVAIAAGALHSLVLQNNGNVLAWGWNQYGQTNVPPGLSNIVAIAGGGNHSLALRDDGTVFAWGAGTNDYNNNPFTEDHGQSRVPNSATNIVAISAGFFYSLALRSDGTVIAWGDNTWGETNIPAGLSNVVAISAGAAHNLALKSDGTLIAWGDNTDGASTVPAWMSNVVDVSAGHQYSVCIMNDGSPFVARQPTRQIVNAGSDCILSVGAVGTPPLSFQWQFNGTNIDAGTNAILSFTKTPLTSSGSYQCIVSNFSGSVTSAPVTLNVLRTTPQFQAGSSGLQLNSSGFGMQLKNLSGHGPVIVYGSSNLMDWLPFYTNQPVLGDLQITDPSATNFAARFYRAVEQ